MTYLKDPLAIIMQHEHSFSLRSSSHQVFQARSDKKIGLLRRGHCIGTLALAQPVAGLCDPGLKGITGSIPSEGGDGPTDSSSSRPLLAHWALLWASFEEDINKQESTQVAGDGGRNGGQRSWEALVYCSKFPRAIVRLIAHRNRLCSQYFSGQSR